MQTFERLELPLTTYNVLERIAKLQSVTPVRMVENLVNQYEQTEKLRSLRQEYQELTDKALSRTISAQETNRLSKISVSILMLEQSNRDLFHIHKDQYADSLIESAERLLAQIPA